MNAHPTTEQLLLDCSRELMEDVLPTVSDEATIVRIAMIEQVLRNAAARCAHEIAWMVAEIPSLEAYGRAVLAAAPGDGLVDLLHRLEDADDGLELDAVTERYARAGEVLATALEVAVLRGARELQADGERLLDARLSREEAVMAGWSPTGR